MMVQPAPLELMNRHSSSAGGRFLADKVISQGFNLACACGHLDLVSAIIELAEQGSLILPDYTEAIKQAESNGHCNVVRLLSDRNKSESSNNVLRRLTTIFTIYTFTQAKKPKNSPLAVKNPPGDGLSNGKEVAISMRSSESLEANPTENVALQGKDNLTRPFPAPKVWLPRNLNAETIMPPCSRQTPRTTLAKAVALLKETYLSPCGSETNNAYISLDDYLLGGPGGVIKKVLPLIPDEPLKDKNYGLLLQISAAAGDFEGVDLLLHRGLAVNIEGWYYGSALQAAARYGNLKILQRLLASDAHVNILGGQHGSAILAAVKGGHLEIVNILIENSACVNPETNAKSGKTDKGCTHESPLQLAIQIGRCDIANVLLDAGANVNVDIYPHPSPLHLAVAIGRFDLVKKTLDAGADVNAKVRDRLPLIIDACHDGDTEIVKLLLASGADINASGEKLVKPAFATYRVSIGGERASALHMCCLKGHLDIVAELIARGADINKTVENSETALALAADQGHIAIVRLLIEAGANVNVCSTDAPLECASRRGHLDIVYELISAGASIGIRELSAVDRFTSNALKAACLSRRIRVIRPLLEHLRHN